MEKFKKCTIWQHMHYTISFSCNNTIKGGVISESFSIWIQSPKKGAKYSPELYPPRKDTQESDLALFLGDWSQTDILRLSHL